jgi:ADP-ribosylglycohydrolase
MGQALMEGHSAAPAHQSATITFTRLYKESPELGAFANVSMRNLANLPEMEVNSGGYVMETLHAALWCLLTTSSFEECVLKAVNLGSDTDTTGCVAGGLAGVYYGEAAIPEEWREALPRQAELADLFARFIKEFITGIPHDVMIPEGSQPLAGD